MIEVYERHVQPTPHELGSDQLAPRAVLPPAATQSPTAVQPAVRELLLTHEQRSRGRLRLPQPDGVEVRLFLQRGEALQLGEYLRGTRGELLRVAGAVEDVATARCDDWATFSKACYHLGNRHVKIQIGERWLRIVPDHVLEDMLRLLGLSVQHERAVFDPEGGAYAAGHVHHHDDQHGHTHDDDHDHHDGGAHSHAHEHVSGDLHGHQHSHDRPSHHSLLLRHGHHKH